MHPIICVSRVGLCDINERWRITNRTSEFWRLYHNYSPGATVEAAGGRVDPGNGQVLIIPAHCAFSTRPPASPTRHLFIHFTISANLHLPGNRLLPVPMDDSLTALLGRPEDWDGDLLRGCALVYRTISLVLPGIQAETGQDCDYSLKYIQDHLQSRLSVARMAHQAGCSTDHFIRTFARRYGMTPARYVARLRVEMAQKLLSSTAVPLDDIASMCGFNGRSHLWSTFRRETGQTPSHFRANAKTIPASAP